MHWRIRNAKNSMKDEYLLIGFSHWIMIINFLSKISEANFNPKFSVAAQQIILIIYIEMKASSYNEILPGIYLGDYKAAKHLETLEGLGITHIVIAASDLDPWYQNIINYKQFPQMDSGEALTGIFRQSNQFIKEAVQSNGKVLIHCQMGVARSATLMIAYVMQEMSLDMNRAIEFVGRIRRCINPNPFHIFQLRKFENELFGTLMPYFCKFCCIELFSCDDILHPECNNQENQTIVIKQKEWMPDDFSEATEISCPDCGTDVGEPLTSGYNCSCGQYFDTAAAINKELLTN
ncbi:DUSP19_2 [Blepharisma stoltei]|uniref:protein-tyrosine-phosphatase n=1 Tax=Blepharisma stoltei TaxID=1481888 RepID=A0AAU9JBA8_9CILI|nr:unnamed protein product [Blepharisma stoltei]